MGEGQGEGETQNPKHAPHCPCGARRGARTHEPTDHDVSHPGAPMFPEEKFCLCRLINFCLYHVIARKDFLTQKFIIKFRHDFSSSVTLTPFLCLQRPRSLLDQSRATGGHGGARPADSAPEASCQTPRDTDDKQLKRK